MSSIPMVPVLVVEDDDSIRELIEELLQSDGFPVVACADGLAAKEQLDLPDTEFGLMIVDLMLPHVNGLSLIQYKQQTRHISVPVIIFSANTELFPRFPDVKKKLKKPVELEEFLSAVKTHYLSHHLRLI